MGRKRGALQTGSSRLNDGDAQIWRQSKEIETMNFVEEIQSCNLVYLLTRLRHFEALFCLFKKCARSPISKYSNSDSFPAGCARSWLVSFCFILFHFVSFCFILFHFVSFCFILFHFVLHVLFGCVSFADIPVIFLGPPSPNRQPTKSILIFFTGASQSISIVDCPSSPKQIFPLRPSRNQFQTAISSATPKRKKCAKMTLNAKPSTLPSIHNNREVSGRIAENLPTCWNHLLIRVMFQWQSTQVTSWESVQWRPVNDLPVEMDELSFRTKEKIAVPPFLLPPTSCLLPPASCLPHSRHTHTQI